MKKTLRPYQQKGNDDIAAAYASGKRKLIYQLPTGGGKTITACSLINRFASAMPSKKIIFAVHRDELLKQFRRSYFEQFDVAPQPIIAGNAYRDPNTQIYVTMVETANNRLKKSTKWFGDVGLVVIDEAHIGNFKKLFPHFEDTDPLIIGLTATPISSSKKHPLKELYQDIITSIDIPDLISQGALVPNKTYHIKGQVSAADLKIKAGEFDSFQMSNEFSKNKHIQNCVKGYEDHALGKKTIIFNCSVEHSLLVTDAFTHAGYNGRHLDGEMPAAERESILKWFKETPDAILCNIGILTAGFDEPSIEAVIMNRATLSLPLWLQCTGRGSRPFTFPDGRIKDHFVIIDLGGNAVRHGDWSRERDWADIFHNPPQPGKGDGAAPVKICESCGYMAYASARKCPECGELFPFEETQYDRGSVEFELLSDNIDIPQMVTAAQQSGQNPYKTIHQLKKSIISQAKEIGQSLNDTIAYNLLDLYQMKVKEWCRLNGKDYNQWHKDTTAVWFFEALEKECGYIKPTLKIAL